MNKHVSSYTHLNQDFMIEQGMNNASSAQLASGYTPYLIATAFVATTALLVLLLSVLMDSKTTVEKVISASEDTRLLADARNAFGHTQPLPGHHLAKGDNYTAAVDTDALARQKAGLNALGDTREPLDDYITRPIDLEQSTITTNNQMAFVSVTELTPVNRPLPSASAEKPAIIGQQPATIAAKSDHSLQTASAPVNTDTTANVYNQSIEDYRSSITEQIDDRYELSRLVNQHLTEMRNEIWDIENRRRSSISPAASAYDKINYRRHNAFKRLTHRPSHAL